MGFFYPNYAAVALRSCEFSSCLSPLPAQRSSCPSRCTPLSTAHFVAPASSSCSPFPPCWIATMVSAVGSHCPEQTKPVGSSIPLFCSQASLCSSLFLRIIRLSSTVLSVFPPTPITFFCEPFATISFGIWSACLFEPVQSSLTINFYTPTGFCRSYLIVLQWVVFASLSLLTGFKLLHFLIFH